MEFERYNTRLEAGIKIARLIEKKDKNLHDSILKNPKEFFCFAIPNGGVPVAEGFCQIFNLSYSILIVRKIKIPYNPEAGFGAVTTDGTVLLNQDLLPHLNLSKPEIERAIQLTKNEINDRLLFYQISPQTQSLLFKKMKGKTIFLLDDGLASGFTILAAIEMVKKYTPKNIHVAVPTAPIRTIKKIQEYTDKIFCPHVSHAWQFAVANAYKHWYDIPESEVLNILKQSKYYTNTI
ncbi:MAG: phosphoribosyltransferase [Promethearchaeota archaeon]